MTSHPVSLASIFDGWDGYHTSIVHAIQPLTPAQLNWRPGPNLRSVGDLAGHIASARLDWFARMPAPGSEALAEKAKTVNAGGDISGDRDVLLFWLDATWKMIADTLNQWTTADLERTYRHAYDGQVYAVSYQWTIWRILTHDLHHGGELALMLGMQGLEVPELGDLFGHLTMPPLAK
jgi:uncharacterized damage-inducible protein DinB